MSEKIKFGSKIGIIAATVGSAVGLGNVWRFPAETQANGGAVFLLIYILCIFILGIPVMTAEFSLGRGGNSDAIGAFRNVTPHRKGWWMAGALAILASYLILSFYMVVSGWTLEYLFQSITGNLYTPTTPAEGIVGIEGEEALFQDRMAQYITGTYRPLVMTYVMLVANLCILALGVQKGIEKMSNVMMPVLFVLLLIFCAFSLTLPKASEGLSFFLKPDFSAVTPATFVNALGQAFFSLSLAMGILVTYSSYYPANTKLTRTAVTVWCCGHTNGCDHLPGCDDIRSCRPSACRLSPCVRNTSGDFRTDGWHTVLVNTVFPSADRGGFHIHHITCRGVCGIYGMSL